MAPKRNNPGPQRVKYSKYNVADAIIASPLRDIGKYRLITNGDFDPCDADVFLLDSLVLIDN